MESSMGYCLKDAQLKETSCKTSISFLFDFDTKFASVKIQTRKMPTQKTNTRWSNKIEN